MPNKTEFTKPDGGYYNSVDLTPEQHAARRKKERAKTLEAAYKLSVKGRTAIERSKAREQGLKISQLGGNARKK
jgi:hypothetical protein